jgi:D-3-phosphoglycerate dehydrogenase
MPHILVADKIDKAGLAILEAAPDVTFDVRPGLAPADLTAAIGQYDGVLIRSAVRITRETLATPGRLVAIARAGVGVDNVDLDAATSAGVLVLNTPDANTISTAEHTIAMMLALHRRIPDAHAHLRGGGWERGAYAGDEVAGRTLGIVGFGRIGRAVAARALGLEMKVLAFDPFIADDTALEGRVRIVRDLHELLKQADCVTLHAVMADSTRRMIDGAALAVMKPGARLINCARGELVDEAALAAALNEGRIAGAAIDVFSVEPPKDNPLLSAKNVVLTPHLAASTSEAQERVSVDAAEALLAYLLRGEIRSAVNIAGLPPNMGEKGRAYLDLCSRMGAILAPWCPDGVDQITLTTRGDALRDLAPTLALQAVTAVIGPHLESRINLVNARAHADSRGIKIQHSAASSTSELPPSLMVAVRHRGGAHQVEGTVHASGEPRILSIDGYRMDIVPERCIVLIFNDDRPGVIGLVGQRFGDAKINIADMALSRRGGTALMVLKLDEPMPADLRENLRRANPPILSVHTASLPPVEGGGHPR